MLIAFEVSSQTYSVIVMTPWIPGFIRLKTQIVMNLRLSGPNSVFGLGPDNN